MRKVLLAVLGVGLAGGMPAIAAAATSTTPTGGAVQIWVTPNLAPNASTDKIVITGAIGDYGTATSETASGVPQPSGGYVAIKLTKGTFMVNSVSLNKKLNSAPPTMFNLKTCSVYFVGKGPVTVYKGTGIYAGISGTITIT